MKRGLFIALLFVSLLTGIALSGQDTPGIPVFGDDFNVSGLFIENWETSKNAKCEDGHAIIPPNGHIILRRVPDGDFAFTADLTVEKPEGNDVGHCGVIIDRINFMITPAEKPYANTAYREPGQTRSKGNVNKSANIEFGKPCRIMVSRQKLGDGYKYSYKVNGTPIDSFQVVMPQDGKIKFYAYKNGLKLDNFQLYSLKGDGSLNLAVNSSFEYLQEGMPNYMRPLLTGLYTTTMKWPDLISNFAIDTKEKVSGNNSVRMTCAEGGASTNGVATFNVNVMSKTPVTFSIYLKASEDDFPAMLNIWELHHKNHQKPIKLSKEWQRYSFTLDNPERATIRGSMSFSKPGTVWADDIQVEIGNTATPYKPSSLDKDKYPVSGAAAEAAVIEKDIVLKKAGKSPVIDGEIEDVWFKDGAKTDKFFLKGFETPKNKTEAWLTCDDDNLYLAVRAYVPDTTKVKGTKHDHDTIGIHSQDCIEVLLDTTFGRERYYHLTANAAGSRTDIGPGRIKAWNGNWNVATKINEKEKSIDYEMQFPLSMFADTNISDKWGLNIGRNDTDRNEVYSLIHVKASNFHIPSLFPSLVFPDGIMKKYKVGVKDICLVSGKDSKTGVSGTIGNLSEKALDSEIRIIDAATGNVIGQKSEKLGSGNTEVMIPSNIAPDVKAIDGIVKIMVDGKERSTQPKRMILARQLEVYPRYNYYMNEPSAVLVGSLKLPDADKLTGKVTVAGKTFNVKMEPEFALEIPLAGIENGEHQVTLDVYKGSEKLVSGNASLIKREFKNGAVQIDRQRRCLVVDGKPYLAIAPFFGVQRGIKPETEDAALKNMVRLHKEMGYKCFLVGAVDDPIVARQTQKFMELCEKEGIKVIYWPFQSWHLRAKMNPQQRMESMKGNNIIAWMVVDEPELYAKSEEVETFMDEHRKLSPYTPVFMNNTLIGIPGRYAGLKTDILMLDDYLTNRENRKVVEMIDATYMMWEAGKEDRKPVFYFLTGENLHNHYRECTYAEQVAETYGVVIAGCRGVSYFCSMPLYPEDYRASVDVNRELLELEDVIFSLEKTSNATTPDSTVKIMTKRLGGKIYVIALNSSNDRDGEVEITLPSEFKYAGNAEVKFENRKISVKNGKITDKFKALERHVYIVDIAK